MKIKIVSILTFLLLIGVTFISNSAKSSTDTMDYETVNYGSSSGSTNKNSEDGIYEQITEQDENEDENYSTSIEVVDYGTAGGDALPGSLLSDDASYRTYQEENTKPSNYIFWIFPDSDSSIQWDGVIPTSPTAHYVKINQPQNNGDGTTTYVWTGTASDKDIYTMSDVSTPLGEPSYDIQCWGIHRKSASQTMNIQFGIRIGSTDYSAYSGNSVSAAWQNNSNGWLIDPSDSSEWTLSDINSLYTYVTTSDASPTPYLTQMGIKIYVNYTIDTYYLETYLDYTATNDDNASSFAIYARGYRSGTENFLIKAYDWITPGFDTLITINSGSEVEYSQTISISDYIDSSNRTVWIQIIGETEPDTTQDTLTLDVLKIQRTDIFYWAQIEWRATGLSPGNLTVHMKGYVSESEDCLFYFWNYTTSIWDWKFTDNSVTNHLHYFNIYLTSYVSSSEFKIRIDTSFGSSSDIDQTIYYLDWLVIYYTPVLPTITNQDSETREDAGGSVTFWATYTSAVNEAPTYFRVTYGTTFKNMYANNSGDTYYVDGKDYYYIWDMFPYNSDTILITFKTKSASSTEVTAQIQVDVVPYPYAENECVSYNESAGNYTFSTTAFQIWDYPVNVMLELNGTFYDMTGNDTNDNYFFNGESYYRTFDLNEGLHTYQFWYDDIDFYGGNVTYGTRWLLIQDESAPIDYNLVGIIILISTTIGALLIVVMRKI